VIFSACKEQCPGWQSILHLAVRHSTYWGDIPPIEFPPPNRLAHGEKEKDSQEFDNQTVAGRLVGSRQKSCEDFLHSTLVGSRQKSCEDFLHSTFEKRKTLKNLTIKLLPAG
jgi:hypothetical protein